MIVTQGNVAESNIQERHSFSIKANAKAFKLLSSNLYSDKPLAIVRELGCNALDSHVAAGKADVPFKIVLPSDMHPWLEIIDYGTGLSDEQVKNIFTTYFESTKTTSNDYIGAMGLGSKSPFAYTDAFEVFARQGGVENTYTCFLNKSGAPEIFLLETKTDASLQDGVTIKVPVKANDYHLFRAAAQKAYKFFPVKPIVGANTGNWTWEEPVYGFEGTNFKVLSNQKQCYALMGPVAYPLDLNQFKHDGFMQRHMNSGQGGFVIDFGIGKLDVNAGREGLSYDEDTIANLEAGVKNICVEMSAELTAGISKCKNLYEAIQYRFKHDQTNLFDLKFDGKSLNRHIAYNFTKDGKALFMLKEISSRYIEKLKEIRRVHDVSLDVMRNAWVILVDEKKKYQKKIRYAEVPNLSVQNALVIQPVDGVTEGKDQFKDIVAKFEKDGVPYKYISEIEDKTPVIVREKKSEEDKKAAIKYTGFYKYKKARGMLSVGEHDNLNGLEMEVESLYLKWDTTARRYCFNGVSLSADEISYTIWNIIDKVVDDMKKPLVIVTHKVYDKIPKNWVDISTLIKGQLAVTMSEKAFRDNHSGWVNTVLGMPVKEYDQIFATPSVNPVFKEFFDEIRKIKFGAPIDYTTSQFFRRVYQVNMADAGPYGWVVKFDKALVETNNFVRGAVSRYYNMWPVEDFTSSLIVFSAMMKCGIIDENKLKDILKSK